MGTVILFPGRTEYLEKYGRAAADLRARGYAMVAIDWRGQGLSARLHDDPLAGHVEAFADYQRDVAALMAFAAGQDLPRPFHLLGHSMGGCIGLRALHEGLDVASAAFSAPMWGIGLAPRLRPLAWSVAWASRGLGLSNLYAPGTGAAPYADISTFEGNMLTSDGEMFAYMQRQTRTVPALALGGPSLNWLIEALIETRALRALKPPATASYIGLGSLERIVDPVAIRSLAASWPQARLDIFEGAEHELMMERAEIRTRFFDAAAARFAASGATA